MPRIRTLKPEHKQHRKVGLLTDRQYRLWVGMVTEADDDGRLVADASWLRAVIFPYQPKLTVKHVADALEALVDVGLIRLYTADSIRYAAFPSWRDHQRLDRAHYTPSRLPAPPRIDSPASTASLPGVDPETRASQGSEGNLTTQGRERKGGESEGRETANGSHEPGAGSPAADDAGLEVIARAMNITLDEARRRRRAAAAGIKA